MKRIALIAILSASLLSSCVKSDDFDALSHDLEITGQLRPSLGLPIGESFMGIGDLLGSWQTTGSIIEVDPNTHFITFVYADTIHNQMVFSSSKNTKYSTVRNAKDGSEVAKITQHYTGNVGIDLFNNIDDVNLIGTYVDLSTFIKAYGHDDYETLIATYKLKVYFTNITFSLDGANGGNALLTPADECDTVTVSQMLAGYNLVIADHTDLSPCLALHPNKISYGMDMVVEFSTESTDAIISDTAAFVQDNLNLDSLVTNTTISANFPLQIQTTSFQYNMDVPMDLSTVDTAISSFRERISFGDSSYLALRFINTLPFSFLMSDLLYDASNSPILDEDGMPMHIYGSGGLIDSPQLKDTVIGTETYYVSNGVPVETILKTNIGDEKMDRLLRTRKMVINIRINSGSLNGGVPAHVTVRDVDKLATYIYIVTNPESMQD